jgi:tetratricopeptide (TPR) repeat protein
MGDMYMKDMEFDKAVEAFSDTVKYQEEIIGGIRERIEEIGKIREEMNKIKKDVADRGAQYGTGMFDVQEKKGKLEAEQKDREYLFTKLNAGKVRWNLALSYERMGELERAIEFYRKSIEHDYNSNDARDRIQKLQLKINRGY